jgi:hypothetical protein
VFYTGRHVSIPPQVQGFAYSEISSKAVVAPILVGAMESRPTIEKIETHGRRSTLPLFFFSNVNNEHIKGPGLKFKL